MTVTITPRPPTTAEQPQAQSRPTPRRSCEDCSNPTRAPFNIDPANRGWHVGDVIVLHESIHAPIDDILPDTRRRSAYHPSSGSPSEGGSTRGKARPAIVWRIQPGCPVNGKAPLDAEKTWYLLMASYEGCHRYDQLPTILKDHFILCVSPHDEIRPGDSHVHTTPEWQARSKWLVAIPFTSDGHVARRWGWKNEQRVRQDDRGFQLEPHARDQLRDTIEIKMKEWVAACLARPGYLKQCKDEYEIFRNPEEWKPHLAEQADRDAENADTEEAATEEATALQRQTSSGPNAGQVTSSTSPDKALGTPLPSEPTLPGLPPAGSKNDSDGPGNQSSKNLLQGNGIGETNASDGDTAPWSIVQHGKSHKKKLKKTSKRQRTMSGMSSRFAEFMGVMKGRQS
ncbi:hypothetical protein L227DRAFT_602237 [Lentinus tigrinus ALCF2SS1-6]|uniref:Uncharacterized protein n=1 Tax=Lentinus tigrinus ALCF2SS1-6 TaxID=1328759 RepID=A0A5C2S2W2_9APHY|nr:hypothetical protein L227DRAFT_602237 [Lentinus tigrinus ALCF2SS1-6]